MGKFTLAVAEILGSIFGIVYAGIVYLIMLALVLCLFKWVGLLDYLLS